jgi:hypothetical protein
MNLAVKSWWKEQDIVNCGVNRVQGKEGAETTNKRRRISKIAFVDVSGCCAQNYKENVTTKIYINP